MQGSIFTYTVALTEIEILILILGTIIVAFIAGYWASRRFGAEAKMVREGGVPGDDDDWPEDDEDPAEELEKE
ncbi:MAG: hypothetical protein ACFFBD_11200 [Candidatus Hodarchaeota archaeon]